MYKININKEKQHTVGSYGNVVRERRKPARCESVPLRTQGCVRCVASAQEFAFELLLIIAV